MKSLRAMLLVATPAAIFVALTTALNGSAVGPRQDRSSQVRNPEHVLDEIRTRLKETKRALAREGKYSCCIAPSCDFCALSVGKCPCNENLSKGDAVCHECKGGWKAGLGVVEGIDPTDVKTPPADMNRMMYETRAKKYLRR